MRYGPTLATPQVSRVVSQLSNISLSLLRKPLGSVNGAETEDPVVAITFDDGPHPDHTPAILEALAARNAKATFFFIAHRAESFPELARTVVEEGHEVGLHGLDHLPLPLLTTRAVVDRVRNGRHVLEGVINRRVGLFRPPYGRQTLRTYAVVRLAGMQVVGWTALCEDWKILDPDEITDRAVARLEPGGILLLHDFLSGNVSRPRPLPQFDRALMVAQLLDKLEEKGLESHTVTDLITRWPERRTLLGSMPKSVS